MITLPNNSKTYRYLYPCLTAYPDLIEFLNTVKKSNVKLFDFNLEGVSDITPFDYNIFIQIYGDNVVLESQVVKTINHIRKAPYYVYDYCVDTPLEKVNTTYLSHMIVVKIPHKYRKAYDEFLLGNYSKMYSKEEVKTLFKNDIWEKEYSKVVSADFMAITTLMSSVKNTFDTEVLPDNIMEYDLPLLWGEETLNYKKEQVFI